MTRSTYNNSLYRNRPINYKTSQSALTHWSRAIVDRPVSRRTKLIVGLERGLSTLTPRERHPLASASLYTPFSSSTSKIFNVRSPPRTSAVQTFSFLILLFHKNQKQTLATENRTHDYDISFVEKSGLSARPVSQPTYQQRHHALRQYINF